MTNIIMKKLKKILLMLVIIQFIFAIVNTSEAANWIDSANDFLNIGKNAANSGKITSIQDEGGNTVTISLPSDSDLKSQINDIYNIIFPIAVVITVVIGGALGIKFMMASAEDKAKVKESLVPYVVGCVIIYGAFGIWRLAITIFSAIG